MGRKLIEKRFIRGSIEAVTGLHIGGAKTSLDIGAIDLGVVKTAAGVPYVPGSSLKGKLRSLLAREQGSEQVADDREPIPTLFGSPNRPVRPDERRPEPAPDDGRGIPGRLLVRDAFLEEEHFRALRDRLVDLELEYTESKWENSINRLTGTAEHPRQLERVPAGVRFAFDLVLNVLADDPLEIHLSALRRAMRLLEDDALGGQGSRGYGRVRFVGVRQLVRTLADYETGQPARVVEEDFLAALPPAAVR